MISAILDSLYGLILLVAGLAVLLMPYEKFKEKFEKAPSKAVVKVLGVIIVICGIGMTALSVMGAF